MEITSVKIQGNGWLLNGVMSVPNVSGNMERELIIEWLKTNTPEPEFTEEELLAKTKHEIEQAIQKMLDDKAKELRYDNMMSARSYAGFDNPFQREAQALAVWCANCWLVAGQMEASGEGYTVEEVLAQMPVYGA